ncbi:MAG TPA: hypothetical protein VGB18_06630 [Candidatus Thermoplasmatota archaeon]
MEDSIGVRNATKDELAQDKPETVSWDAFLQILHKSVDRKILRKNIEKLLSEVERLSYDRAIARVEALRAGKTKGYTLSEAKERVGLHRLAKQADEISQLVRTGAAKPKLEEAAKTLDHQLHAILPPA